MDDFFKELSSPIRIVLILAAAFSAHLAVLAVRRIGRRLTSLLGSSSLSKARTVVSLATSIVIFTLYFCALGLVLSEFGVSLKAYLASASIMGLAIGFGLQGFVQDVVTGLTLIFSDLFDVGDMVEISGQTGIVRKVGMRFTVLENPLGAEVFIPNRSITNVVNYPRGYVRGFADITLSNDSDVVHQMEQKIETLVSAIPEQFPGILLAPPSIEGRTTISSGKEFLRVKFCLWPGRGAPIETTFKQEVAQALKLIDAAYADWMITVYYEVEKTTASLPLVRLTGSRKQKTGKAGQDVVSPATNARNR
jgi:hypothetical protein